MRPLPLLLICATAMAGDLPPPAARDVDFVKDIQPLLESSCVKCHAKGKERGGFSLETREGFYKGGDTGAAMKPGDSAKSLIVELVSSSDPETVMPQRGKRWTPEQVGLLRAWIDQGAKWPDGVTFSKPAPQNLSPRKVAAPAGAGNPVDRVLARYFAEHGVQPPQPVGDAVFARRVHLDVTGLLPTAEQLAAFEKDAAPDKRARLVSSLLEDTRGYADHWLTFWNDLLRNDYRGTGYIDGGRKQITGWLHAALRENKPYDRFVAELVDPRPASEGFTKGIVWRGSVNASMLPAMQAAQSVSQVFLGVNLKCASCHDSFINDWALADCYGLAAVYTDDKLELVRCDKPQGKTAQVRFLYPEIGGIEPGLKRTARMKRLAELMLDPKNGRVPRTIVNRLWARLLGRGLVEPLDDMEKPAWSRDLLDWLAEDLVAHQWDLKHTIRTILTSRAYALPSVEGPRDEKEEFIFRGPLTRRMTAEQFSDAISSVADEWAERPDSKEFIPVADDLRRVSAKPRWIWLGRPLDLGPFLRPADIVAAHFTKIRASRLVADPLQLALDRPNREIITPARITAATTIQALELTNGATLDARLKSAAKKLQPSAAKNPAAWIDHTYRRLLSRAPTAVERQIALGLLGAAPKPEAIADFLWAVVNLPEFQLIN